MSRQASAARSTAVVICLTVLGAALSVVGVGPADARPVATMSARRQVAQAALARAELLLVPRPGAEAAHSSGANPAGAQPRAEVHAARPHRDATLALRDLELYRPDLSPPEQERASNLLERPVLPAKVGTADIVVHYDPTTVAPTYPQQVLDTATKVHDTYLAAGYRTPEPDGIAGDDARLDIYLTNLGTTGAYGYCAPDRAVSGNRADRPAFCVLDNGFTEFPGNPTQILQVTLAHEYFHAVQFAYDSLEDGWFMEGTAVWAEDQVFDDVNDNMQYAPYSPLAGPRFSLDTFEQSGYRQYGSWLWFRWLSERYPDAQAGLPVIVREMWEAADSTTGVGSNLYSIQAIKRVLKAHGTRLVKAFALFADANRRSDTEYDEGAANRYPTAPLAAKVNLSSKRMKSKSFQLDHLTSATTRFVPKKLASRKYRLKIVVDLANKAFGSAAVVTSYLRNGSIKTKFVRLDKRGDAVTRTPFSSRKVSGVEVTLVNASQRFDDCYRYAVTFSCYGRPVDQSVRERVRASVVR